GGRRRRGVDPGGRRRTLRAARRGSAAERGRRPRARARVDLVPGYPCRMEGLKLDQAQLERLVELDRKFSREGLTFDDVLLQPAESAVLPNDVSTRTRLTRSIELAVPVVSAPIATLTEARMAIALAREGGSGGPPPHPATADQAAEVSHANRSG